MIIGKRLIAAALLTMMSVGCNSSTFERKESADKQATLTVWHQWTAESDAMRIAADKAIADYMLKHPDVNIETYILDNEAYKTKISMEFAGSAKEIDIFFYWGGGRGGKMAETGKLLPIGDYISDDIIEKIKPGATTQFEYSGKLYGLPIYSWMMILYCNKDMFDEVGAKIPETYEELVEASKRFRENGVDIPIAQGIKESWQAAFVYEALAMREVGVDKILKMFAGEVGMDDPGYLSAAVKTKELYEIGAFGDVPLELANNEADVRFLTGKSPMRLQGSWFSEAIYADNKSLLHDKTIIPVNIPMTDNGNVTDYCGGFIDTFFINNNTKHVDVAVDFYTYFCQEMSVARQRSGQGFSGFITPIDDSKLPDVSRMVADIARSTENGVVAWDTGLSEAKAAIHLKVVQSLFTPSGDPLDVIDKGVR